MEYVSYLTTILVFIPATIYLVLDLINDLFSGPIERARKAMNTFNVITDVKKAVIRKRLSSDLDKKNGIVKENRLKPTQKFKFYVFHIKCSDMNNTQLIRTQNTNEKIIPKILYHASLTFCTSFTTAEQQSSFDEKRILLQLEIDREGMKCKVIQKTGSEFKTILKEKQKQKVTATYLGTININSNDVLEIGMNAYETCYPYSLLSDHCDVFVERVVSVLRETFPESKSTLSQYNSTNTWFLIGLKRFGSVLLKAIILGTLSPSLRPYILNVWSLLLLAVVGITLFALERLLSRGGFVSFYLCLFLLHYMLWVLWYLIEYLTFTPPLSYMLCVVQVCLALRFIDKIYTKKEEEENGEENGEEEKED